MNSTDWELVFSKAQAHWLPYDAYQEVVDIFYQSGSIRVANQDPDQFWNVSSMSAVAQLCSLTHVKIRSATGFSIPP